MNLPFVTLDTWTLIFTWVNLFVLFLIVKKLFFKPMQNMLAARDAEIKEEYSKAEQARKNADELKCEYEEKMASAALRADEIVADAVSNASLRSEAIVKEAEEKAQGMVERAHKNIEAQKETAFAQMRDEVSEIACDIARKIIEKDIDPKEHEKLIDKALEGLGE